MRLRIASLLFMILVMIGFSTLPTKGSFTVNSSASCSGQNCSDPWAECKQKVKVVGRDGNCVTFACEVGTKNEHLIKTSSEEGKKTLFKLAEDSDKPKPPQTVTSADPFLQIR